MEKNISIHIPKPCFENWDAMDVLEKGRHCAVCKQTVTDFRQFTDKEILLHLNAAAKGGKGNCGRFNERQLNRVLVIAQHGHTFRATILQKIAASFLFFQSISFAGWAQTIKHKVYTQQHARELKNNSIEVIQGYVKDYATGEPLPGMQVQITGTGIQAFTDASGFYILHLPDTMQQTSIKIIASYTTKSGLEPSGTIIPAEEVNLQMIINASNISLLRYPVERNKEEVINYYKPFNGQGHYGGYIVIRRPTLKQKLMRFFHKKRKHSNEKSNSSLHCATHVMD